MEFFKKTSDLAAEPFPKLSNFYLQVRRLQKLDVEQMLTGTSARAAIDASTKKATATTTASVLTTMFVGRTTVDIFGMMQYLEPIVVFQVTKH